MIGGLSVWLGTAAGSSFVTKSVSEMFTDTVEETRKKKNPAGSHDITSCCLLLLFLSLLFYMIMPSLTKWNWH